MASQSEAPAASLTVLTSGAKTTSTVSAIDLVRALRESAHHGVRDAIEKRLEQLRQGAAGELVLEREVDAAGVRLERAEAPGRGGALERPLDQPHVDRLGRPA